MNTVRVEAGCGRLEGVRHNGISVFKGIPYGTARRWARAEARAPWAGVRAATQSGPVAPQRFSMLDEFIGRTGTVLGEDCLNLNVYTPETQGAGRPVMVWIHGGAFLTGSGCFALYDASAMAAQGVVVVTINYRLGALGFARLCDLTHGHLPTTGNLGLQDQILALEWVRDHISAFGGDARNVTVFGESAGAMSLACLLVAEAAHGLFHKAILQSGAGHIGRSGEHANRVAHTFLKHLDLSPSDSQRLLEAPFEAILKAQCALIDESDSQKDPHGLGSMPFQPVIDEITLSDRPIAGVRSGLASGIPVLCGTTREEWKLWTAFDQSAHAITADQVRRWTENRFGDHAAALLALTADLSPYDRYIALQTGRAFGEPCRRLAVAQSVHAPVYQYEFAWGSDYAGGVFGSCHAAELGFVFGTYAHGNSALFHGDGPNSDALSAAMIAGWTSFASSGVPTLNGLAAWPQWGPDRPHDMVFGADGIAAQLGGAGYPDAWRAVPEPMIGP